MKPTTATRRTPAVATAPELIPPWHVRWYGKVALLLLTAALLTLAFAPINQFYFAWVALVPWLTVVSQCRSQRAAFLWSWLGGTLFFTANMWWLANVSVLGMISLMVYLGLYWGFAALLIRGGRLLEAGPAASVGWLTRQILLIATLWSGLEFVRGNFLTGLPWLYLGHTQSPILVVCQIADITGVYGVTFWVVAVNALAALVWIHREKAWSNRLAWFAMTALLLAVVGYGIWCLQGGRHGDGGTVVVSVVQPNYPQDNSSGEKGASDNDRLEYHFRSTAGAIKAARAANTPVDLVAWSETMLPPVNPALNVPVGTTQPANLAILSAADYEYVLEKNRGMFGDLSELVSRSHANLITGALTWAGVRPDKKGQPTYANTRNTALFIENVNGVGRLSDARYDKIHLVPFGEFIPFRQTLPWLYNLFLKMSPYDFDYTVKPGADNALTVFTITAQKSGKPIRFVVPICFEDIDSRLVARMINGGSTKRADLLVNLTNDGWFQANENPQHLQAAIFRSIENRVPTARTVNMGISAFIDSNGHVLKTISQSTTGVATETLQTDSRFSLYTRYGDVFAMGCLGVTALLASVGVRSRFALRRGSSVTPRE